ncbi:MAG: response regulator [Rhodobacterales bacterium]
MNDQPSSLRVLVVEDMWIVAEDLAAELEDLGCQVVGPAGKLEQGLQIAQQEQLDGAFLDVNLGAENSFPIAAALRERGVPFAFLTGYDLPEAFPPELVDIPRLHKPVHPGDLANALAAF